MKKALKRAARESAAEFLHEEHEKIRTLLREFDRARGFETRKDIFGSVAKHLRIHTSLEEEIVYPRLYERNRDGNGELAQTAYLDHQEIDYLLDELSRKNPSGSQEEAEFVIEFRKLTDKLTAHMEREETGMFPLLEEFDDRKEMAKELGNRRAVLDSNYPESYFSV